MVSHTSTLYNGVSKFANKYVEVTAVQIYTGSKITNLCIKLKKHPIISISTEGFTEKYISLAAGSVEYSTVRINKDDIELSASCCVVENSCYSRGEEWDAVKRRFKLNGRHS